MKKTSLREAKFKKAVDDYFKKNKTVPDGYKLHDLADMMNAYFKATKRHCLATTLHVKSKKIKSSYVTTPALMFIAKMEKTDRIGFAFGIGKPWGATGESVMKTIEFAISLEKEVLPMLGTILKNKKTWTNLK